MPQALKKKPLNQSREDYRKSLFESLERRLPKSDLSSMGSPEDLADRMIAALPNAGAAWSSKVGPVYTSQGLQKWLRISRQAISQKAQGLEILRLRTSDRIYVFPSFQFTSNGRTLPHLKEILCELAEGTDDAWIWAVWLNTPDKNGTTHAEKLSHGNWESVREAAREDAIAWSGQ